MEKLLRTALGLSANHQIMGMDKGKALKDIPSEEALLLRAVLDLNVNKIIFRNLKDMLQEAKHRTVLALSVNKTMLFPVM